MLEALAAIIKALLYAGLLTASGVVFVQAILRPAAAASAFLQQATRRAALLTLAVCPVIALILIARLGGGLDEATLSAVFLTSSGAAICLQLTGALLLLTAARDHGASVTMRLSHAVLGMASFVFSGHAASLGPVPGLVVFAHVSLAAWWIGSLWYLHQVCKRFAPTGVVAAVKRFNAVALVLVGILVVAGLMLIWVLVDFSSDPWRSGYGQILALKLGIVAAVLGVAVSNRLRLTPRLMAGDVAAIASLRQAVVAELVLIGMILLVTAVLTSYVSPHQ